MGPTRLVTAPVDAFRRLPDTRLKATARDRLYRSLGTPRGHPRLQLPRKNLLTDPHDTIIQVGTPNVERVHQYAALTDGQVLILEPNPENYERLAESAEEYRNVTVDPRAAGETNAEVEFRHTSDHAGAGRLVTADGPESPHTLTEAEAIAMETLDGVTADHGVSPDYVEIMVNGAETNVLRGANRVLSEDQPKLLVKSYGVGDEEKDHRREITSILERYGYNVTPAPERDHVPGNGAPDGDIYAWV